MILRTILSCIMSAVILAIAVHTRINIQFLYRKLPASVFSITGIHHEKDSDGDEDVWSNTGITGIYGKGTGGELLEGDVLEVPREEC